MSAEKDVEPGTNLPVEDVSPIEHENGNGKSTQTDVDLDELGEREGYVVDLDLVTTVPTRYHGLKTAKDGHTVLIPQPSEDPEDPLNWSWKRKHIILFVISACAFLPDYGSATGAVTLLQQAEVWNMPEDEVNHSQSGNVFMLGAAGPFIVALSAYFGRLPVLFWFMVMATWTAAWDAGSMTFDSFFAARVLNGFFATVSQAGGLMFLKDMFFFHEHARKINIWASFIILSPYFGPMFAAFITSTQSWHWAFGLYAIMTGICFAAVIIFVDETFYNRKLKPEQRVPKGKGWKGKMERLVGIEQFRTRGQRSTVKQAVMRPIQVIMKPTVFLSCVYYMLTFAWVVGINTTLAQFVHPLYGFGPLQIGYFYFTPIVAAVIGEIVGHWLHDALARVLTRRNKGTFQPEFRLTAIYISTPFMLAGLVTIGFCFQKGYHYMVTSVAWGIYVFGIMITTVAITAYNLDSYPEGSGEVAAWVNFGRTLGGFIISYFQVRWAHAQGTEKSFGIQAAISFAAFLIVIVLQIWGERIRRRAGPLHFKTG